MESDACLTGTKATYEQGKTREKELRKIIAAYPKTQSVNNGTVVKHFLDYHRAYNPMENSQQSKNFVEFLSIILDFDIFNLGDRRAFTEPPIPGYKGYIPRIGPTDLNLGLRYHEAAKKGLNRFATESTTLSTNLSSESE